MLIVLLMLSALIFLVILAIRTRDELLRLRRKMECVEDLLVDHQHSFEVILSHLTPRE